MDTNTSPAEPQSPFPQTPPVRSGNIGPLAAAVVIVVLLAAGGFYFFWSEQQQSAQLERAGSQNIDAPQSQSNADDQLETELNATQTSGASGDVDNLNGAL